MLELLNRAEYIHLIVFVIFALSYGAGYVAGSLKWVNYAELMNSRALVLSGNLRVLKTSFGEARRAHRAPDGR